jgi:hypothetical protein
MLTGKRAMMAMTWMWKKKHRKPTMNQHRMWKTEGIVLESAKIGQHISVLYNMIKTKQMQRQVIYRKRRLYCNKSQHLKPIPICGKCSIRYIAIAER